MAIPQDLGDEEAVIELRKPLEHEEFKFIDCSPRTEPLVDFMPHVYEDDRQESGGSIRVRDHENRLLASDPDDGEMYYVDQESTPPTPSDLKPSLGSPSTPSEHKTHLESPHK